MKTLRSREGNYQPRGIRQFVAFIHLFISIGIYSAPTMDRHFASAGNVKERTAGVVPVF